MCHLWRIQNRSGDSVEYHTNCIFSKKKNVYDITQNINDYFIPMNILPLIEKYDFRNSYNFFY